MAVTKVTTDFITSSLTNDSTPHSTLAPCRTTYANLGDLTTTAFMPSPPPSCQVRSTFSAFSDLVIGNTTLFPCSEPLAYLSCKSSAEVASSFVRNNLGSCNDVLTYYSLAWIEPPGWTWVGGFAVTPTTDSDGRVTNSLLSVSINDIVRDELVPKITGTHNLYCPTQWTLAPSGPTYACQSIGRMPDNSSQGPHCSLSCDATNTMNCQTITQSAETSARTSQTTNAVTYGIDPAYLIYHLIEPTDGGDGGTAEREWTQRTIAAISILSFAGAVLTAVVVMAVMRYRFLKRKKGEGDLELPDYPGYGSDGAPGLQNIQESQAESADADSGMRAVVADPPSVYCNTEAQCDSSRLGRT